MAQPIILIVDDDVEALRSLADALSRRYAADYQIAAEHTPQEALERLDEMRRRGAEVALILADQWMPEQPGVEFLGWAHDLHPYAKRCLLIAYGDVAVGGVVVRAMALRQIESYFLQPWGDPEQWLYPAIGELLGQWARENRPAFAMAQIVGDPVSARVTELKDLLSRNSVPFGLVAADSDEGRRLLRDANPTGPLPQSPPLPLPLLVTYTGQVLANPSNAEIAEALGARTRPEPGPYDLAIVGGGPAGLAAAVYGASEGLRTLLLEREAVGGQAGTSSMIRNYLGFPTGISGAELAWRASEQALLFGVNTVLPQQATGLRVAGADRVLTVAGVGEITSRAVVIATGVAYNRLNIPALDALTGCGVFYGAAVSEAHAVANERVFVVGAGNSGGQAAIYLADYAGLVTMLVRGPSLSQTMSDYLVRQVEATPNIFVRYNTRLVDGKGAHRLEGIVVEDMVSGAIETLPAAALFVLIGASPHTGWLAGTVERDTSGYILTGQDLLRDRALPSAWPLDRLPYLMETSVPGVFAAGDVRARSVKRVASAVRAGAIAVQLVHQYLDEQRKV
jgi:thioredoxin reductase (NADPH)